MAEQQLGHEEETLTEVVTGIDTTWQALQLALETEKAQSKGQTARRESLLSEIARAQGEIDGLARQELTFARLTRELTVAEAEYNRSRDNLRRAEDAAALDLNRISSVSIVQPATQPLRPARPHKLRLLALIAFLALCAGLSLALIVEAGNSARRRAGDVRIRLGLPALAPLSRRQFAAGGPVRLRTSPLPSHKEP